MFAPDDSNYDYRAYPQVTFPSLQPLLLACPSQACLDAWAAAINEAGKGASVGAVLPGNTTLPLSPDVNTNLSTALQDGARRLTQFNK